jgi:hypothetical protein
VISTTAIRLALKQAAIPFIPPHTTRTFLAICWLTDRGERITARRLGSLLKRQPAMAAADVRRLRQLGLISFEEDRKGVAPATIRPLFRVEYWPGPCSCEPPRE